MTTQLVSNSVMPTDVVSDITTEALIQGVVCLPTVLVTSVKEVATQKVRRKGALVGSSVAENVAYVPSVNDQIIDTSVNLVAAKFVSFTRQTHESKRFTDVDESRIRREQGAALARALDAPLRALTSGLSQVVTSATILTVADMLQAAYLVQAGVFGGGSNSLVAWLDFKGLNEIRKEIVASAASVYTMPTMPGIFEGMTLPNGYSGKLLNIIDVFTTTGLPLNTGDDVGTVFDRNFCFAACVDPNVIVPGIPSHTGGFTEMSTYTFFNAVEVNDAAGCGLRSDT